MTFSLAKFLEKNKYFQITLIHMKSNHFGIEAQINDKKGFFILDTGASNTCLSLEKRDFFNLEIKEQADVVVGTGSGTMAVKISNRNTLKLGEWSARKLKFMVIDFSHINQALVEKKCSPVQGIIGADILKRGRAVIDYHRKKLYLK